ncbi:MAG: P-type conjugative transfer protein TrbL [Candidatus Thiodiazotropha sp.]
MKNYSKPLVLIIFSAVIGSLLLTTDASAAINNDGIMDQVLSRFESNASNWAGIIESAATRLFWTLVLISMVITFGFMALRKADIGEFFAEFTRFTIFTGFFWWLLVNGPDFARSIINSLRQLGGSAAGLGGYSGHFSPSEIVDIGFIMLGKTLVESSILSPVDSAVGIALGFAVLLMTAMIAVNVLLLYVTAWMMSYGGIFYLGFGGSRWTSEMAINYFKAVLGIAIQIMTMILIIGIGVSLINEYYTNMQTQLDLTEMAVVTVVIFTIMLLTNKVPQLLSGIITGHAPSGMGIGQFGAGAILGAMGTATAASAMTGSMISSGVAEAAGGMSALKAAFTAANANVASGSDILTNTLSCGTASSGHNRDALGGGPGSGSPLSETGTTPFAQAAGFSRDASGSSASAASEKPQSEHTPGNSNLASPGGFFSAFAHGTADVAKAKVDSVMESAKERIADTTGGRIADAIQARNADSAAPSGGYGLESADETEVDMAAEIAAFVGTDTKQS